MDRNPEDVKTVAEETARSTGSRDDARNAGLLGRWFVGASVVWLSQVVACAEHNTTAAHALVSYLHLAMWLWVAFLFHPWMLRRPLRAFLFGVLYAIFSLFWSPDAWQRGIRFFGYVEFG